LENWDNFVASHTAALAQDWIKKKCTGFIGKNELPTNSPDLSPLDYHDAGTLSEIHAKTDQHCRAEDCLAIDME